MRPIQIHPGSALFGAGLLAVVLVATGAQHTLTNPKPQTLKWPTEVMEVMRIEGIPAARDMVVIRFVLTGLGGAGSLPSWATLEINGSAEANVRNSLSSGPFSEPSVTVVPVGLSASPGDVLEVLESNGGDGGRAWGYLADA